MLFSELLADAQRGPGGSPAAEDPPPPASGQVKRLRGEAEVRRVVTDSRRVQRGDCFVAVRGTAADGHQYIPAAAANGCSAVVCEDASAVPDGLACAVVADTRVLAGRLAQAILDWPCRKLTAVGVTGTNGKTTFTYLLRHILESAGRKVALVGTIAYQGLGGESIPAHNTTPGPLELADLMAQAVSTGATHLVMEVSSHALEQHRVEGVEFRVGVFTNLTGDHLDYHGTMENYLRAKQRLFQSLLPGTFAVLNRDDRASELMAKATRAKLIWYGLGSPIPRYRDWGPLSPAADVFGRIAQVDGGGTRFLLNCAGREVPVQTRLVGRHNVSNCLASAAAALALGVEIETAARALGEVAHVPGRLQAVASTAPFRVLVDYAHTDDALANVLSALRPVTRGKLILVFGCGGDRDRTKRPRMARVAEKWADAIVVTSDNPRSEPPLAIIEEVLTGFSHAGREKVRVEEDRRLAIAAAIASAAADDVVLVAGKGHENYQVVGPRRIHFDDVETVEELLRQRGWM